jgi:hypothetical protein
VLDHISPKSIIVLGVADLHMHGEESRKLNGHLVIKLCKRTYVVVCMIIIWFSPLTLNNYVVQDHTTVHHLLHLRFRPSKSWVPDNGKTRLDHTKCTLDILPSCHLTLEKLRLLLRSWPGNCLHKCSPRWIATISEVVPFGVGIAVDLKVKPEENVTRSVLRT